MTLIVTFDEGVDLNYRAFREMLVHWHSMGIMDKPKRMICSVRSYYNLMKDLYTVYRYDSSVIRDGKLDGIELIRTEYMADTVFEFSLDENVITTKWRSKHAQ